MSAVPNRSDDCPAIRVMMMPRDTNAHGTIFGGVILSYLDQAGAIEARRHCGDRVVTVAMNSVEFKEPVFVGDVLSFHTETVEIGRTSIRVRVTAQAERFAHPRGTVSVTEAEIIYVAVDSERRPLPIEHSSGS